MMRQRLAVLALMVGALSLLFAMNRVTLVDLGLPLERVGLVVGTLAPLAGLVMAGLTGPAMARFGRRPVLRALCAYALACGAGMLGATMTSALVIGVAAAVAGYAALCGIFIVLCAVILTWSEGEQPATDYAILYALSNLAGMVPMIASAQLVGLIGWSGFYGLACAATVAAVGVFDRALAASPTDFLTSTEAQGARP